MKTKIIEATQDKALYGKFLVGRFDREEWARRSEVYDDGGSILRHEGWTGHHLFVLDLSRTGGGAIFMPRSKGHAENDLDKKHMGALD